LYSTPAALVDALIASRQAEDLDTYLATYEAEAAIVLQPGSIAKGHAAVRDFFNFFIALNPTFTVARRQFVEANGVALHLSEWTLVGTDANGNPIEWSGRTADVLRQQSDGSWLVALDNPWGTSAIE
jgi:ketosteroid isomerase-like protein